MLSLKPPATAKPDGFSYDPMNPIPSHGGNVCCTGNAVVGGSLDQQKMEERQDILVYSTDPLTEGMEVSGPIEVTLFASSDAKDTDFTIKVVDVYPDGRAYNLDETIQRVRYREGYDKAETRMEPGKVYKVALQPMTTSNYFEAGHRIRIEVSSSSFPYIDANPNTGRPFATDTTSQLASQTVYHDRGRTSRLLLLVIPRG